jgi:hypothetical protein
MADGIPAFEPLPFRRLIDAGMKRWRRGFKSLLPPFALITGLLTLGMQIGQVRFMGLSMGAEANPADLLSIFGQTMAIMIVWFVLYLLLYGIFKVRIVLYVLGRPGGIGAATRTFLQPAVFGTVLLSAMVTAFGYLFCILPGIYLGMLLSFVLPVILAEGHTGGAALGRSMSLARYNPSRELLKSPVLKILAIYVIGWLLAWAISMLVQLPGVLIMQVLIFRQIAEGQMADPQAVSSTALWVTVPGQVLNAVVQLAVKLYIDLTVVLLYLDIRHRKEGGDLEQAVERLERKIRAETGPFLKSEPIE